MSTLRCVAFFLEAAEAVQKNTASRFEPENRTERSGALKAPAVQSPWNSSKREVASPKGCPL